MIFERNAREIALEENAGVIDKDIDRNALPAHSLEYGLRRSGYTEIGRDRLDVDPVRRDELSSKLRRRLMASGQENKIAPFRCKCSGEFATDSCRCARD